MTANGPLIRGIGKAGRVLRSGWSRMLGLPVIRSWRGRQLRRMRPFANGRQLGRPVVRYYWERFVTLHRHDIHGHCLEVGSTTTLRRWGAAVTRADALDITRHAEDITVVGDLSRADHLQSDTYDCLVIPFTMHLIYDVESALYHSIRILKPRGVLLANFPCVDYYFARGLDMGTGQPMFVFWWFTPIQVENLLKRAGLTHAAYHITTDGNLLARVAYQTNMPSEELSRAELDHVDEGHPLLISVRVVKPAHWQAEKPEYRAPWTPNVEPEKWNAETGHYPRK
jgi:hypothetical protein